MEYVVQRADVCYIWHDDMSLLEYLWNVVLKYYKKSNSLSN